jgi:hypothetical protein
VAEEMELGQEELFPLKADKVTYLEAKDLEKDLEKVVAKAEKWSIIRIEECKRKRYERGDENGVHQKINDNRCHSQNSW